MTCPTDQLRRANLLGHQPHWQEHSQQVRCARARQQLQEQLLLASADQLLALHRLRTTDQQQRRAMPRGRARRPVWRLLRTLLFQHWLSSRIVPERRHRASVSTLSQCIDV